MGRTPGGGVSLWRLAAINACSLGFGLTDGVFFVFILSILMSLAKSRFLAFSSLALGGLLAAIAAPIAAVASTTIDRRATITFLMLLTGAFSCAGIAYIFSPYARDSFFPVKEWRTYVGITLAGLYRACVQASPVVPCIMDGAATRGDSESFPLRRDLSLSFFYLFYRVGAFATSLIIALLPARYVTNVFPIMSAAAAASVMLTTLSTIAFPREGSARQPPARDEEATADTSEFSSGVAEIFDAANNPRNAGVESFRHRFADHLRNAIFKADKRLLACYVEILYYGIAFGSLFSITSCFFNDKFKVPQGSIKGTKWASYVALIGRGIGLALDASLPTLVFRRGAHKFSMTVAWGQGSFFGACLFLGLVWLRDLSAQVAVVAISLLYVTTSTHNLFSLLSCGSLVLPKYRATSFAVRASIHNIGILIGTLISGYITTAGNWGWVFLYCSTACAASGFAAAFAGSVERKEYAGVAANANPLVKYLAKRKKNQLRSLRH